MKIVKINLSEIKGHMFQPRSQTNLQISALADSEKSVKNQGQT